MGGLEAIKPSRPGKFMEGEILDFCFKSFGNVPVPFPFFFLPLAVPLSGLLARLSLGGSAKSYKAYRDCQM